MFPNRTHAICAAAAAALLSSAASAVFITYDAENSEHGLGAFHGSIDYAPGGADHGTLTVTLTNTSDPANGGFITGFVFNIDSADPDATATLTSATYAFVGMTNHAAPPFGSAFTAGAALGGDWAGGGNPNAGIGVGDSGVFVFDVFASDAASLDAESFVSGPYQSNFVLRFRGFEDGESDKVPAVIPGPAALGLLAIALLVGRTRQR